MSTLGDSLSKFPHLSKSIKEHEFALWTDPNQYRTSYNDMSMHVYFF